MDANLHFLNFEDLNDLEVRSLTDILHPSNYSSAIEFPWVCCVEEPCIIQKGSTATLNVHAPVFESCLSTYNNHISETNNLQDYSSIPYTNGATLSATTPLISEHYYAAPEVQERTYQTLPQNFTHEQQLQPRYDQVASYSMPQNTLYNNDFHTHANDTQTIPHVVSTFKLNPTVSSFVPQNISYAQPVQPFIQMSLPAEEKVEVKVCSDTSATQENNSHPIDKVETTEPEETALVPEKEEIIVQNGYKPSVSEEQSFVANGVTNKDSVADIVTPKPSAVPPKAGRRSWADVVSCTPKTSEKVSLNKPVVTNEKTEKSVRPNVEVEGHSLDEDKMALILGKHLYGLTLQYKPVLLQPRGLINRRNWCYVNAGLQALLACPPFYTLLRNLPLGPAVERGKSSTPVLDSMVKMTYEFTQFDNPQEELQTGTPFQPDVIYDMLRDLKSDCLKGQQEDAEEFLSFILNGMHEEMVKVIKHYEKKSNLNSFEEIKENGDVSDGEEEWQVIGSKHKGMVTRKVAEHKTPISDLLGGQIKSLLTTSGNKTSASIQPFFTLQLDIQSDNVTSLSEALKEMTAKQPIHGYTCAKTKQEVEAFSHIALQKLPPILILHLKRFVYNINGGSKKIMKKTDYPLTLEIGREMFSPDVKKSQRLRQYKLFAVMYHDGEETVKGHYISDVYNHASKSWIRCDDRTVSTVTEEQVLSHSPPRVPYLLFYQES